MRESPRTTMPITVLVTGATGTIGSEVVRYLIARPDVVVRAGMHDVTAPRASLPAALRVPFDFTSEATMRAACEGVDRLFLLTPTDPRQIGFGRAAPQAAPRAGGGRAAPVWGGSFACRPSALTRNQVFNSADGIAPSRRRSRSRVSRGRSSGRTT